MQYDDITKMITGSPPDDWASIPSGPLYLDQLGEVIEGSQHQVEVSSHLYLAVYKPDVSLRLAWGIEEDRDLTLEGWTWPDKQITRFIVDAFWQGPLVARWYLRQVDGARCSLPDAYREYVKKGESLMDYQGYAWTATSSEIALARLLNDLVGRPRGDFDRYMEQAAIIELPC